MFWQKQSRSMKTEQQKILLKQQKNKNPALKIKKSCRKYIDTGTCGTSAGAFVRLARGDKSEI